MVTKETANLDMGTTNFNRLMSDKYLVLKDPKEINGEFIECDEYNYCFVALNFDDPGGDPYSQTYSLDFKYRKFNEEVKKVCNSEHFRLANEDLVPLNEAIGIKVVQKGFVFYNRSYNNEVEWKRTVPIYAKLIAPKHTESIQKTPKNITKGINTKNKNTETQTKKDDPKTTNSNQSNEFVWTEEEIKETYAKLSSQANKTSATHKDYTNNEQKGNNKNSNIVNDSFKATLDNIQYLMSGREDEPFFYEGSTSDASGASFKIEYESSSMKGLYSLIVDMNNLRTINPAFRREVIKIENNGTTIREASSFTTISKGEAHFSKEDRVWVVDKPLIIKLLK